MSDRYLRAYYHTFTPTEGMSARNSGYLGGDVSMEQRYRLRDRYLTALPAVDLGWRNQCRCGSMVYAKWRGRWYCKRCARWIKQPNTGPQP